MRETMEKAIYFGKRNQWKIVLVLLGTVLVLPLVVTSEATCGIFVRVLLYMLFATGLNLTNGYSGQFNIGSAGFMCVGAYAAGILATRMEVHFIVAAIFAGLVAAIFGLLLSLPTSRLSGMYLSLVTMGFSEIIRIVALNWTSLTGGAFGVKNIPNPTFFGMKISSTRQYYYLILAMLCIVLFMAYRIIHSRIGRAWISIRENPDAASSLGINITRYKVLNFMVSAFVAGLGGAFMAYYYRYISSDMFTITAGHEVLAMVVLGGMGTLAGPLLGTVVINVLTESLRFAEEYRMIGYALLIIIMMWIRPQGLIGANNSSLANAPKERKKRRHKMGGKAV